MVNFGTVQAGQSSSVPVTVTGSGLTSNISYSISGDPEFTYTVNGTRATNITDNLVIKFEPTSRGSYSATITASSPGATPIAIALTGVCSEPSLTASQSSLDYGNVVVGNSLNQGVTITGQDLSNDIVIPTSSIFIVTKNPGWNDRTGGGVTIKYAPQTRGADSEALVFTSGSQSVTVNVSGTGTQPTLTITPISYDFGTMFVGDTKTTTLTVAGQDLSADISDPVNSGGLTITKDTGWNARTGGTLTVTYTPTVAESLDYTASLSSGSISTSSQLTATAVEPNLVLESNTPITISEATLSKVDGVTNSFYIPSGTVVNTAIVCNNIITKASDITLMDVDLEYTGTTNFILDGVSIYNLKLNNASGDDNLTVSYRNANIQNLTSTDWRAESIINLQPYDIGEESNIDLTIATTFTGNNFLTTNLKINYTSTTSSGFNLTNQSGGKNSANTLEVIGAGDGVLYQYSVDNSSFREITVRNQTVSTLSLVSGIDFTTVVSILFDHVKFLGDALQTLTDTIVNTKPIGSSLTITFENGSDTFTPEQVTALEAQNVTIVTTNN